MEDQFENSPYELHQPTLPTFSTNHHTPTQLYYYIKPPPLHYPQPHPQKYPHHTYPPTYTRVIPQSQPAQKLHLVRHSIPGQIIPL
ncbi:lipase-like domain-containing protein, partial [Staphylococcus saprophyticus]